MKTIAYVLGLFLILGSADSFRAQDAKAPAGKGSKKEMKNVSPEEQAKKEAAHMEKQLGLNQEQKAKWTEAAVKRITANRPLKEKMQGSTTPEERKKLHEVARSNKESFDATVGSLLNPEQMAKYEEMKRNRLEKRAEKRQQSETKTRPESEPIEE